MKKAYIVHGWEGSPDEPMHKWLKKQLENKGFEVTALKMPNPALPRKDVWIDYLNKKVINPNKNTYFIGHSLGCQTILRWLEQLPKNIKIGGVVLIALWLNLDKKTIEEEDWSEEEFKVAKPWFMPIDFSKCTEHCEKFICIFSDNDPYVPLSSTKTFKDKLRAEVIIEKNKGHFDIGSGVKDNSTALRKLLEISK
mgnify:FL=1